MELSGGAKGWRMGLGVGVEAAFGFCRKLEPSGRKQGVSGAEGGGY